MHAVESVGLDVAMERLLRDLQERQGLRDAAHGESSGSGEASAAAAIATPRPQSARELQEELGEARRMLGLAQAELAKERERHEQTRELLRLALKPHDHPPGAQLVEGGSPRRSHTRHLPSRSPNPTKAATTTKAAVVESTPLRAMLQKALAEEEGAPRGSSPRFVSAGPVTRRSATGQAGAASPCNGAARASGAATPPWRTPPAAAAASAAAASSSSSAPRVVFGSRTPRFVDVTLSGDHALIRSHRRDSYLDDEAFMSELRAPHSTPTAAAASRSTGQRRQSPASSRRAGHPGTEGGGGTNSAAKQSSGGAGPERMTPLRPAVGALPSPGPALHTLRSPDIVLWANEVQQRSPS